MMRKYIFLITMTALSFSLIIATPSCDDDSPEVVVGERGSKGEKGDEGPEGARGDKGDKGDKGEKGEKGDDGTPGERGPKGDYGDKGEKGDKGDKGDYGEKGDKGEQGEQGEQGASGPTGPRAETGPKGDTGATGNANVKRFSFEVAASQWEDAHFGAGNNHSYFEVKPELTGGIRLSDINYVPLVYASPSEIYREYKQIPYRFNVDNNYVILLEMIPSRHYLTMLKSTNGISTLSVPLSERPSKVRFTVILIEIGAVNAAKGKVNFDNFNEVTSYFKINR